MPDDFLAAARVSERALRSAEDAYVDELFAAAPEFGAALVRAEFSRAYIDANRDPWELDPDMFRDALPDARLTRSPRVAHGLGAIPRTTADGREIYARRLSLADAERRIADFHAPYHAALSGLLEDRKRRFGAVVLIDCHSMPAQGAGRAEIVLGDRFGESCDPRLIGLIEQECRNLGLRVTRNAPYAGGYTTARYGRPGLSVSAVQIEIRRPLYMNEASLTKAPRKFARLKAQIDRLIAAICDTPWESLLTEADKKQPRLRAAE